MSKASNVRVRFAPSPTGFLHIGGARTALFNWLYARANNGKFLLRIEDTDRERSETRYTEDILESLRWLGFDWDEEPVFQSQRFERYTGVAKDLISKGLAYRCVCTQEELDAIRKKCEVEKRPFRYPGTCREKGHTTGVTRIRVPQTGETGFTDLIRGPISFANKDIDDWVILRADGSPTYNFSVVIDDNDQGMTHILRGDDHINNTPKQILLYQTLGFQVPEFAHLPMIIGPDRQKLSKRHGAASTLEYRKMGYLPATMINFLVRLGWSHGDQELFTVEELKKAFNIEKIGKANAMFNPEKLTWISGHFMRETSDKELLAYALKYFPEETAYLKGTSAEKLELGIGIIKGKVKNVPEMIEQMKCLFGADPKHDVAGLKPEEKARIPGYLKEVIPLFQDSSFTKAELEPKVRQLADKLGIKLAPLAQAIRFGVTGGSISPGLFEMLEVQGKDVVLRRLQSAVKELGA